MQFRAIILVTLVGIVGPSSALAQPITNAYAVVYSTNTPAVSPDISGRNFGFELESIPDIDGDGASDLLASFSLPSSLTPRTWAVSGATGAILFGLERVGRRYAVSVGVGWIEDRRADSAILLLDGDTARIDGVDTVVVTVSSSADGSNLRTLVLPHPEGAAIGGTRAIENAGDLDGDDVDDLWVTASYQYDAGDAEVTIARAVSGAAGVILWETELHDERTLFDIQPLTDQTGDGVRDFAITLYSAQGGEPMPIPRVALFDGATGAHLRDLVAPIGASTAFGRAVAVTSEGVVAVGDDGYNLARGRVTLHDAQTGAHLTTVSAPDDRASHFGYDLLAGFDLSDDGVPDLVVSAPGSRAGLPGLEAPRTIAVMSESGAQTHWAVAGFESFAAITEDIGGALATVTFADGRRWVATSAPGRAVGGGIGVGTTTGQVLSFEPPTRCFFDITGDGAVNGADLGALLGQWGQDDRALTPLQAPANFNSDPVVNAEDLGLLIANWGTCD
ncbi:MAG: hypothetical protein ACF8QF_08065 [Phycisphaerales bacterium]